jgi:hypothetical protein
VVPSGFVLNNREILIKVIEIGQNFCMTASRAVARTSQTVFRFFSVQDWRQRWWHTCTSEHPTDLCTGLCCCCATWLGHGFMGRECTLGTFWNERLGVKVNIPLAIYKIVIYLLHQCH